MAQETVEQDDISLLLLTVGSMLAVLRFVIAETELLDLSKAAGLTLGLGALLAAVMAFAGGVLALGCSWRLLRILGVLALTLIFATPTADLLERMPLRGFGSFLATVVSAIVGISSVFFPLVAVVMTVHGFAAGRRKVAVSEDASRRRTDRSVIAARR